MSDLANDCSSDRNSPGGIEGATSMAEQKREWRKPARSTRLQSEQTDHPSLFDRRIRSMLNVGVVGLFSGLLGLLLVGCANRETEIASSPDEIKEPETLTMRDLAQGTSSGIRQPLREVIRSQEEWDKLWGRHVSQRTPQPSAPEVDFDREMVIVATMGKQSTGGYQIQISQVRKLPEKAVQVTIQEKTPPEGAFTTQALTYPFHFAAVPKTDLPVRFVSTVPKAKGPNGDSQPVQK